MLNSDNLSTLFNSLGNKSMFSGIDLNQYSLVKSGAYGKALKAYYAKEQKNAKDTSATTSNKKDNTVSTNYNNLKKNSDSLSETINVLSDSELWKNAASDEGREKLVNAVNSFADNYNRVLESAEKVNSSDIKTQKNNMTGLTSTMSKYLSKVGLTAGTDGNLSLDKDKLSQASVGDVKALFYGKSSYGTMVKGYADSVSKSAVNSATTYNGNGNSLNSLTGLFETIV